MSKYAQTAKVSHIAPDKFSPNCFKVDIVSFADMIGIADYVVFGVALVIPIIMALYYACIKKQKSNFEFLMANRNMSAFPIGFSLAANYLSAVIVTGKFSLSFAFS